MFVNEKENYKFKANNKNVNFLTHFCLESITNRFDYDESEEVSFKFDIWDFSVDYDTIDKSELLKIHKYLMVMNNLK